MEEKSEDKQLCKNCKRFISAPNFELHSLHCKRNIKVCKKCKEPVKISEQENHMKEYHVVIPCNACEEPQEKWMLPKHKEVCPKRLVPCEFCGADISLDELQEHEDFCGSRTDRCFKCHQRVMKKDYNAHMESHEPLFKEVKQNKLNEKISENAAKSKQNIHEKVPASKHRKVSPEKTAKKPVASEQFRNSMPEGAVAPAPDKKNKVPKKYYHCTICNENIAWEDVRAHLPRCADAFGKCMICLKSVAPDEMRSHTNSEECRRYLEDNKFGVNVYDNYSENVMQPAELQGMEPCPFCEQICSLDRIEAHIESCSKNKSTQPESSQRVAISDKESAQGQSTVFGPTYECPLCKEKMSVEQQRMHESFYCNVLLNLDQPNSLYSMPEDIPLNKSQEKKEDAFEQCPCCCKKFTVHEITQHTTECLQNRVPCSFCEELVLDNLEHLRVCPKLISTKGTQSYAQAAKKPTHTEINMTSCVMCKERLPIHQLAVHHRTCVANKKACCIYCNKEIHQGIEEVHLRTCPSFNKIKKETSKFAHKNRYEVTGAVPKHAKFPERVPPRMSTCRHCKTTYNADILVYHESECGYREIECSDCFKTYRLKDLANHQCKSQRKGKKDKGNQRRTEGISGLASSLMSYFKGEAPKSSDEYQNERNHLFDSYPNHNTSTYINSNHEAGSYMDRAGYSSGNWHQSHYNNGNESLYFSQPLVDSTNIPCEFCNKTFPAFEIVEHETGCKPEEVSYPKSLPVRQEKKTSSRQNEEVDEKKFFPVNERRFTPSTKYETIQDRIASSKTVPGEFLKGLSRHAETNVIPNSERKSTGEKTEPRKLQSVWNKDPSESEGEEAEEPETCDEDRHEKMSQDENEREKEIPEDVEMHSISSDEGISHMIAFIDADNSGLCDKIYKEMKNLDCSEENDLNARVECNLSSPEIDTAEDASIPRNNKNIEGESVKSKKSYNLVTSMDEIESTKHEIKNFSFGRYRMEHLDDEEINVKVLAKNESSSSESDEDVPVPRNDETEDPSVQSENSYEYVGALEDSISHSTETAIQRIKNLRIEMEHPYREEIKATDCVESHASKLDEEDVASCEPVDSSRHEKRPYEGAYNYILNDSLDNAESSSEPVSDKLSVPKSFQEDHGQNDSVQLDKQYSYKSKELEYRKSELKVDDEDSPRQGVPCEFCKDEVPLKEYDAHVDFCGNMTVKCVLCLKYVQKKDRTMHAEMHLSEKSQKSIQKKESRVEEQEKTHHDTMIKCRFCEVEVPLENFLDHTDVCGSSGYQCKKCKKYIKNRDRRLHSKMHSDEKERENQESAKQDVVKKYLPQKQDIPQEKSKHYTTCKICHQVIAWIDYNTHLPNCATGAGKCSRCGSSVASIDIKEHVLRTCPMLHKDYVEQKKHFYEEAVQSMNPHQSPEQMPKHYSREVPTKESVQKPNRKSIESKNPAFMIEPAEDCLDPFSGRDRENNSLVERKSHGSYSTAENLEKWAKWSKKME